MAAIFELYFQFQFRHMCVVDGMPFNVSLPNLVVIGRSVAELWHHPFFKMAARESEIYFPVQV